MRRYDDKPDEHDAALQALKVLRDMLSLMQLDDGTRTFKVSDVAELSLRGIESLVHTHGRLNGWVPFEQRQARIEIPAMDAAAFLARVAERYGRPVPPMPEADPEYKALFEDAIAKLKDHT